jgi:hypothetical protein
LGQLRGGGSSEGGDGGVIGGGLEEMMKELQKRGIDAAPAIKREEGMTREQLIALGRERDHLLKEKEEKRRRVDEREEMAKLRALEESRLAEEISPVGDESVGERMPVKRKHRLTDEIMEALGSFCFLPLCPESRRAFLGQTDVPDLLGLLTMPEDVIDAGPDAIDSPHELGIRCLSKLLTGCESTRDLDKVMDKVGCEREWLGPAVANCLSSSNGEVRRIALEIVGLFQDEEWGEFVMRHGLSLAAMELLVKDSDEGVVSAAKTSLRRVAMSDAGLGAVFSGESLKIIQDVLEAKGAPSMRMAEALLLMGKERQECRETCKALRVKETVEDGIQSDDECVCLNALELAYMLPLGDLSPELVRLQTCMHACMHASIHPFIHPSIHPSPLAAPNLPRSSPLFSTPCHALTFKPHTYRIPCALDSLLLFTTCCRESPATLWHLFGVGQNA